MLATRRSFIKLATAAAGATKASAAVALMAKAQRAKPEELAFRSKHFNFSLQQDAPGFTSFALDGLGYGAFPENAMQVPKDAPAGGFEAQRIGNRVAYFAEGAASPVCEFRVDADNFGIRSEYGGQGSFESLTMEFRIDSHATLLGLFDDAGKIKLPALLHFPAAGTLEINCSAKDVALGYDAAHSKDESYIRVVLPMATAERKAVEYKFAATTVYPDSDSYGAADRRLIADRRFNAYRRDYLSMLQLNPRVRALANNVASDCCAFTVFEYSAMAVTMPPLAKGLEATDILRQTLDRYIEGMVAYGMVGYHHNPLIKWDFLDVYPSLLMAAGDYFSATKDTAWVSRNYEALRGWAEKMIAQDADDDGLMEYPASGNAGSWTERMTVRPANWWDTIGFGHKDAYSNALAYRAYKNIVDFAIAMKKDADVKRYEDRRAKLAAVYAKTFYNPETGALAGWKSADGKLHDYYFLFVNGMAVVHELVTPQQGRAIWTKMLQKMKEVGYTHIENGLPGNLIPVRREDYVDHNLRYGGPSKADGSDGFQIYENGGATACYAYYTIEALRRVGYTDQAYQILFTMLKSFDEGKFQGRDPQSGMTYDWMTWDGKPHGYEGLLVDGYMTLLAVVPKAIEI